jgi:hypothetical protein
MKRVSIVALGLFAPLMVLAACSSEADPDDGNTTPKAGAGNTTAGATNMPVAGMSSTTGGTPTTTAGASSGGATTGGGGAASTAGGGAGGAATGGGGAATGGGGAATGGGGAGTGGANAACPMKIDSKVMCTSIINCPGAYCGVFKLGSKNCECLAATGPFKCSSCDYTGSTEPIVQEPTAALPACTAADAVLEDMEGCTLNDRCASLTPDRFCACFTDPVKGTPAWDCDAIPAAWK